MDRITIQSKAIELGVQENVLLLLSVRLGKTKVALEISKHFGNKHLIVTSEILICEGILGEIMKFEFNPDHYTIICYDSLHKYTDTEWDSITIDECEHMSELRLSYLQQIKAKRWIGLCAKVSKPKKTLLRQLFKFKEYKVSYNEATKSGILAEPKVYFLDIYLDDSIESYKFVQEVAKKGTKGQMFTCKFNERFDYLRKTKGTNDGVSVTCTAKQYIELIDNQIEFLKQNHFKIRQQYTEAQWLRTAGVRKAWIANYKKEVAKEIIEWMQSKRSRFMVFLPSITMCNELGRGLGVTHSKNDNIDAIKLFNEGKVDEIYVVDRGREGITINGIEEGLIVQASGSDTKNYQTVGRIAIGEAPLVYVLRLKNTRDEDFVKKLREDIDDDYITEIDYVTFKKQMYENLPRSV